MSLATSPLNTQTFVCLVPTCGKSWSRPATKGRPPHVCPECRDAGRKPVLPTDAPAPAPRERVITPGARHHFAFATLLTVAKARLHSMLVGPAGSGKTTAASQIGKALSLPVVIESCNPQMSKWDLMGFMSAAGTYTAGILRESFENGGVVLLDEIDASNPEVLVTLNNVASTPVGGFVTFPDGATIPRHGDFVIIAGANTWGDGADDRYTGRQCLDAATLDRFVGIAWGYDTDLEFFAAGDDAEEWVRFVQKVRAACERVGSRRLVTPRASIMGAALLRAGMAKRTVETLTVFKGWTDDEIRTVRASMRTTDAAEAPTA